MNVELISSSSDVGSFRSHDTRKSEDIRISGDFMDEFATQGMRSKKAYGHSAFSKSVRTGGNGIIKYCDSQVLNYNTDASLRLSIFSVLFTKASVLRRSALVTDVIITVSTSIPLTVAFFFVFKDEDTSSTKDRITMMQALTNNLHSVMTFLLGLYLSTSVSRWWALRNDCIGGLWGAVNDISLQLAAYFPSSTKDDAEVRSLVLRWGVLSHELVYKQARSDASLGDLIEAALLTEEEYELLKFEPSKPQVVWSWVCSYFAHLAYGDPAEGGSRLPYPAMVLPQLQTLACKARGCIGQAFAYTDTQIPFSYVHFLGLLTWMHNFVQVINSSQVIAAYLGCVFSEHGPGSYASNTSLAMEIFFVLFYPILFLAILHICSGLLNPLRSSAEVDFPRTAFTHYMSKENSAFHRGGCKPPYGNPPIWSRSRGAEHMA